MRNGSTIPRGTGNIEHIRNRTKTDKYKNTTQRRKLSRWAIQTTPTIWNEN